MHRDLYKAQCNVVTGLIDYAKKVHYVTKVQDSGNNTRALFRIVNTLYGKTNQSVLPSGSSAADVAARLGTFFHEKIEKIVVEIEETAHDIPLRPDAETSCVPPASKWETFDVVSCEEVTKIIKNSASKSCALDPITTDLVKACIETTAPLITNIVNASLQSGLFPTACKQALVTPLLKKHGMDNEVLSNYRPVSNIMFLSKVLEKVVTSRLNVYLKQHGYHETMQSAYRECHSTETALLKIKQDITLAIGNRKAVLLVLLDLSAAFDTINHELLNVTLKNIGIDGLVLQWFASYLSERQQFIVCDGIRSSSFPLSTGVPQGSVLGPVLFTLYTSSLGKVLSALDVQYHFYADDTQIYMTFDSSEETSTVARMEHCIEVVRHWMVKHHLKMNDSKTEMIYIGNNNLLSQLNKQDISVGGQTITSTLQAKSLGVILDETMSLSQHVDNQCRSAFIHLRCLSRIKSYLTPDCLETLVHAFITSKLDYCNALYLGVPNCIIEKLQSVQNAAARLITGTRSRDHITPVLYNLHWLPVNQRIKYKVLLMIFKCRNDMSPSYISEIFVPYQPARNLRSSDADLLVVPFTRSSYIRERAVSHAGPRLWNALPLDIRQSASVDIFKKKLKTFLFNEHFK